MSMREFEQYLKASDFFADVMNTHRVATAEIIASFANLLRDNRAVSNEQIKALLKALNNGRSGPSIDSSRRLLVARIEDALKGRAE